MKKEFIEYEDGTRIELDEDDVPELGEDFFRNAKPVRDVFPELAAYAAKRRGQRGKQKTPTKQEVKLRLDPKIVAHFKAAGAGWQTRINALLLAVVENTATS